MLPHSTLLRDLCDSHSTILNFMSCLDSCLKVFPVKLILVRAANDVIFLAGDQPATLQD